MGIMFVKLGASENTRDPKRTCGNEPESTNYHLPPNEPMNSGIGLNVLTFSPPSHRRSFYPTESHPGDSQQISTIKLEPARMVTYFHPYRCNTRSIVILCDSMPP